MGADAPLCPVPSILLVPQRSLLLLQQLLLEAEVVSSISASAGLTPVADASFR